MKHNFLIGLGGSGGKIITQLYDRLNKESDLVSKKDVVCIAIDTDQRELDALSQLGVEKVRISDRGTVGQMYTSLGGDVADWCPNTKNEGVFFGSSVHNGASQCRLKSRLCFSNLLKDNNNEFKTILEKAITADSDAATAIGTPPKVLIVSSIAGGTGSGIFIQTALYIKKFFKEKNIHNVNIIGLFACPDLYVSSVNPQQVPNLYSNAYAVVRELNALNLICGPTKTAAYGGKLDIDIEISTACEGKLFEKDSAGRYTDKPYDTMYFIDKVNSQSAILGTLSDYYNGMANIAYSHMYTDLSGVVSTHVSNELNAPRLAPNAIYGSAGASSIVYPYNDIIRYFANRSIKESFDGVWTALDNEWLNYYEMKCAEAAPAKYSPAPNERATHYIEDFKKLVKTTGASKNEFSFLNDMIMRGEFSAVDALFRQIKAKAVAEIADDSRISKAKESCGIANINSALNDVLNKISSYSSSDENANVFSKIADIDEKLETYSKKCITYVDELSVSFANGILCDSENLWNYYDQKDYSIVTGLLKNESGEWIHPVAARYLLYVFRNKLDQEVENIFGGIDTPADDVDDFYNYLMQDLVMKQRKTLSSSEDNTLPNAKILQKSLERFWGKRIAGENVKAYFLKLSQRLETANETFANALVYFSLSEVRERLNKLISQYEMFFDNIGDFVKKATAATTSIETMHDIAKGTVYVCASAEIKNKIYEIASRNIDLRTGETASRINEGLFAAMRKKAATGKKETLKEKNASIESFFDNVSDIVAESAKTNPEIQGNLDKNVFDALIYEYCLTNPDYASDVEVYSANAEARNRVDQFITDKLFSLSVMAAPYLLYDAVDTYEGIFEDTPSPVKKVSNFYRYFSHNTDVQNSILRLIANPAGGTGAVQGFYSGYAAELPKDTSNQTVTLSYVESDKIDQYSILCYSAVHCLQPYQIKAFDELGGGVYYEHYSACIATMEEMQLYSMTPHLDKRWHKHGVMPYINISMEIERRLELAKAFVYALCYGKIGYTLEDNNAKFVFADNNLGKPAEIIFYKGNSIPYHKVNRAMSWFADNEALISAYAARFDILVAEEIEKLSDNSETVGGYKKTITDKAQILNRLKSKLIRAIEVIGSKNGKEKKLQKLPDAGLLELAWALHVSEEKEIDKDYGELLVELLCNTINKYSKAPYNADDIENKVLGSEAYNSHIDVRDHIAKAFLESYAEVIESKIKNKSIEGDNVEEETKSNFGRDDLSELNDDNGSTASKATAKLSFVNGGSVARDKRFVWASSLVEKYLIK